MSRETITGVTNFHSETGTEGGYWAVQDSKHIKLEPPTYGVFAHATVYDAAAPTRRGVVLASWHQDGRSTSDPIHEDPDYYLSELFKGIANGDRQATARLAARWGFVVQYPEDRDYGTPNTEPRRPKGVGPEDIVVARVHWDGTPVEQAQFYRSDELLVTHWDYRGLHVLKDGDRLTVYAIDSDERAERDDGDVIWEGEIKLNQHDLFTEDAGGMWIHADQDGMSREEWAAMFMREHPCKLVTDVTPPALRRARRSEA